MEQACPPCQVYPLTDRLKTAVNTEAERLKNQFPPTDQCYQIGQGMIDNIGLIRTTPYMWRDPNNDQLAAGDSHSSEPSPGAGVIHVALGFDLLNPNREIGDVLKAVEHEMGHYLLRLPQGGADPSTDPAGILALPCRAAQ